MLIKVLKLKLNYKFWYSNRLKHWPYCYYINLLVLVCHAARGTGNGSEFIYPSWTIYRSVWIGLIVAETENWNWKH